MTQGYQAAGPHRVWALPSPGALARIPVVLFAGIAVLYFATLIVGAVRWYSPVPFWDMWDGDIGDYFAVLDGRWIKFLVNQANEHRIVFSKLLFWLDVRYFGGRALLLLPANIALAVALWIALCAIGRRLIGAGTDLWVILSLALAAPCFSWMQSTNIYWGFQSQWFFAYLFPLSAFVCLAISKDKTERSAWFIGAMAFAVASLGAMANGLLVFPLLLVMQVILDRSQGRRIAVIGILGGITIAAWFHGYAFIAHQHVPFLNQVDFVAQLVGAPFIRALHSALPGYILAAVFMTATLALFVRWLMMGDSRDPIVLGLLIFIAYVGASAGAMAMGRAGVGGMAALTDRYGTPSLLAWAALAILAVNAFKTHAATRAVCVTIGLAVAIMLLPTQIMVFNDEGPKYRHANMQAALALKLGVMDPVRIGAVYPMGDNKPQRENFFFTVKNADRLGLSIFSDRALSAAVASIGKPANAGFHACTGHIEAQAAISGEERFAYTAGWVFDGPARRVPRFAYLAAEDKIVGVVTTGQPRPDVADLFRRAARYGGFEGYVTAANVTAVDGPLTILCADADS